MKDKKVLSQAWELIKKSQKVVLLTHRKPDGDGVGACAALEIVLTRDGKEAVTIYPDRPEFEFARQPRNVLIGEHSFTPDLIIVCDTANYERAYFPDVFRDVPLINIDHHVSNSIEGTVDIVDPVASSACEVLYHLFKECAEIDEEVANALLSGILYDSRIFHTQMTTAQTLRIAADLIDCGADLFKLKCELLSNKNPSIAKLWSAVLGRIEVSGDKKSVWTYILQSDLKDFGLTLSSTVGFVDFLGDMTGVDITILFYETEDGKTKASFRSKEADVNALAAKFGGGGHKNAAGALSEEPLKSFMAKVVEGL